MKCRHPCSLHSLTTESANHILHANLTRALYAEEGYGTDWKVSVWKDGWMWKEKRERERDKGPIDTLIVFDSNTVQNSFIGLSMLLCLLEDSEPEYIIEDLSRTLCIYISCILKVYDEKVQTPEA